MRRRHRVGDAEICAETFGDPGDPAVVLVAGATSAMEWWPAALCERIAAAGRFVVRYDLRDTGESTTYPRGEPGYTGADLVDDVVGLADALGIGRFHLVGISMGGALAYTVAVLHPGRLLSLTLLSTSAAGPGTPENGLPPASEAVRASFSDPAPPPDWNDREAVVAHLLAELAVYAGRLGVDEEVARATVGAVFDRSADMGAGSNHYLADGATDVTDRLGEIAVPTLVVHGGDDPFFPPAHGEDLARRIPGAELLVLDGVGHEVPPAATWDVLAPRLVAHTAPT